jgi:hypothetical protein
MSTSKTTRHRWAFLTEQHAYNTVPPYNELPASYIRSANEVVATDSVTYGSNFADWRKRIALGQSATTSLVGTHFGHVITHPGIAYYIRNGHLRQTWVGDLGCYLYFGFNNPAQVMSTVADQRARQKFLSHYIQAKNSWRGANFVAEIGETIHMLRHPVSSLFGSVMNFAKYVAGRRAHDLGKKKFITKLGGGVKVVRQTKRVNPHGETRFLKQLDRTVSDTWLTWAFGVKPLIADCNDAGTALNNLKERLGGTGVAMQRVKGHGRETILNRTIKTSIQFVSGGTGPNMNAEQIDKIDNDVRYVAGLRARLEDLSTVLEHFGFDPYDVVPAVWEAIPWSFFIDYFVNVQEMIDSMRLWSADFSYCYRSVRNAGTRNFLRPYPQVMNTAADQRFCDGGGFHTLSTWVSRSEIGSVPQPSFEMRIPGIDSSKWLNIAALREQVFRASGKRF